MSDHNLINFEIKFKYKMNIQDEDSFPSILSHVFTYSANFKLVNDKLLKVKWKEELDRRDVNDSCYFIMEKFLI